MGHLLFPSVEATYFSVLFTVILLLAIIYLPYRRFAAVLKYLCIVLLVYLVVPFLYKQDWLEILASAFIPHISFNRDYLAILVGILGYHAISPLPVLLAIGSGRNETQAA